MQLFFKKPMKAIWNFPFFSVIPAWLLQYQLLQIQVTVGWWSEWAIHMSVTPFWQLAGEGLLLESANLMVKHCLSQRHRNLQLIPRAHPVGFLAEFLDFWLQVENTS